jgi:hypothetical protein
MVDVPLTAEELDMLRDALCILNPDDENGRNMRDQLYDLLSAYRVKSSA